ncbi:MAG: hypothetical protein EA365_00495 [Gloeocapsa sp. DLM2.Bin57]|nr:MAG: hypothetical protein EA365_00495 [Gloeocapsa sp. DLM2.Bin57]
MDELRTGLELATEAELKELTKILFARGLNPLDYWRNPLPLEIQSQDWSNWVDTLEKRFRYLAADSLTVLQGRSQEVSYRQILIKVCHYLKVDYTQTMSTMDIEAEIFLCVLNKACAKLPASPVKTFNTVLKGGTVLAVNSLLKSWLVKQIPSKTIAIAAAKQGIARYAMLKTTLALIGPVLWTSLIAELGLQAIATNYRRIIPAIVTLAQIRLTRSECWELA